MQQVFSTKERIKILREILYRIYPLTVNSVATKLKLSKGLVSKYFDILAKKNILNKNKGKILVSDSSITKGIKVLFNIKDLNTKIFKKYNFVKSVGLYGSCANGTNTEESDIDIWIRINEAKENDVASLTSELNKKIDRIKVLFLTDKKIEKLKRDDELFYHSLAFGSIILYGDQDGV